ncbi:MAG: cbb3-type cytochrome c oxidase subunit 3 [Stenotrophomonas acidaminiphila]|jgi:cytochrome c oxidase cbb3-type subunit 4|uniref:cbb3-type cytochrome oxidase subunit 3 n=1 Tax=Stenotrophomonas acidaminiphila TaxID=128780 RepID=UPI00095A2BA1|nr:cbb3-type cytochrome c oxidase subunit 3 [Stenotrophomonas acidaminiphila]MBN8803251.1 cbb3-type cytochrome c oxidase subunit 3 [Stenotrophomonas acidaminiphila]MDF9442126.1 cbb3-type cytochrome c oxidase subunit 3 [Stenotrophomonas acidaminiphila]OJY80032.1 MAG: cbb3-type cytochrome C oxidase subunit 3 [Stenotrophomonas sp. 69-14]
MISGIVTALLLVLFIGGWIWAWSPKRKREFEDAARLPLEDDNVQYGNGGERG